MTKLFTVAGTSNLNGAVKFRFANDLKGRVAILKRNGHTDINLMELPRAMSKEDAIAFLENLDAPAQDDTAAQVAAMENEGGAQQETADTIRDSMEAEGEDTSEMSDEFLAEVAERENA